MGTLDQLSTISVQCNRDFLETYDGGLGKRQEAATTAVLTSERAASDMTSDQDSHAREAWMDGGAWGAPDSRARASFRGQRDG